MLTQHHQGITYKFFAKKPLFSDAFRSVQYFFALESLVNPLFIKEINHTAVVDLSKSESEILEAISPKERYKIRRGEKDAFEIGIESDIEKFVDLQNHLASHKDMDTLTVEHLKAFGDLVITKISFQNQDLIMHCHVLDYETKTVYHNFGASARLSYEFDKKTFGRANRLLYYKNYLRFKALGFLSYDFGGYALNSSDKELQNINAFKLSMGGQIVKRYAYMSYPAFFRKY